MYHGWLDRGNIVSNGHPPTRCARTDQFAAYGRALLTHFGYWVERVSETSGRVLRRRVRRKIVEVARQVVYGARDAVQVALTEAGHQQFPFWLSA